MDVLVQYLQSLRIADAPSIGARLLTEYRGIPDILGAQWLLLRSMVGPTLATILRSTRVLLERAHETQLLNTVSLSGSDELAAFLLAHQGWLSFERMTSIYLDGRHHFIALKTLSDGNARGTYFDPILAIRWGLEFGASGIILAHNHPSGDFRPSKADIDITCRFARLSFDMGMPLVDHVIVARGGVHRIDWPYR